MQWFWGEIVQRRAATAEQAGDHPRRPPDRAGLLALSAARPPISTCWSGTGLCWAP